MLLRKTATILIVTAGIICFGWYGCSDDTIQTIVSDGSSLNNTSSPVETYFPLNEGYTSLFNITLSNGLSEIVSYEVGKPVDLKGLEVIEWIGITNSAKDTGYFRATSTALYFYEDKNSEPEKVLELPFTIGHSWERFEENIEDLTDDIFIDISAEDDDEPDPVNEDTTAYPPIVSKTFPSSGAVSMSIENIERLQLNNGRYYSEAVKVSNFDQTGLKKNYYWYVANAGLVKFVLGATDDSFPDGDKVGELLEY